MDKAPTEAEAIASEFKAFTYSVSHDLSAPIRGMVEFSRLLKSEHHAALNDEGKLYLSLIIESGEKLQSMLAGLLQYSRLHTKSQPFSDINPVYILHNCQAALKDKIAATKTQINIAPLPQIHADAEQMQLLFTVLLNNAILYQSAGNTPQVDISAQDSPTEAIFLIRDNGIGIEKEYQENIFQPFKRLHGDGEYPGVGMGLALAKKIIDRHRGRIWVEPSTGNGTSIGFSIPRAS